MIIRKLSRNFIILVIAIVFPFATFAAELKGGENVNINQENAFDQNLYVGASAATIASEVNRDLVGAAGNITITERVGEDLLVAGGNLNIMGEVGEDARFLGGQVLFSERVGGDLLGAGGTIHFLPTSHVEGDVDIAGGRIILDGTVNGKARIAAGQVLIGGTINNDVFIRGAESVKIADDAVINGNLSYSAQSQAQIEQGAQISGEVEFIKLTDSDEYENGIVQFFATLGLIKLLSILVAAVIFVIFFRKASSLIVEKSATQFWIQLVRGFIILVITPILTFFLFLTFIGWIFAWIIIFLYLVLFIISSVYAGVVFGAWIAKILLKQSEIKVTWLNAAVGVLLLAIIGFIPILGPLVGFVFFLVSLGSISDLIYEKIYKRK